jgi:cardiolipin synthase (CMP-forming)
VGREVDIVKLSQIPNIISVFRMFLVVPVVLSLLQLQFAAALLWFAIAGFSDGLDGFLAKHYGWQSRLGSILDPLADKLLLVCAFVTLTWLGLVPLWLLLAVLVRDVFIVIGGVVFHYTLGRFEMQPSRVSKINTFMQIVFVLAVVFYHGEYGIAAWFIDALTYSVLATTVLSGLDYMWVWGRRALVHLRR